MIDLEATRSGAFAAGGNASVRDFVAGVDTIAVRRTQTDPGTHIGHDVGLSGSVGAAFTYRLAPPPPPPGDSWRVS